MLKKRAKKKKKKKHRGGGGGVRSVGSEGRKDQDRIFPVSFVLFLQTAGMCMCI